MTIGMIYCGIPHNTTRASFKKKKKELERKWNTLLWMFSYRLKFVMMLAWRQGMHREG